MTVISVSFNRRHTRYWRFHARARHTTLPWNFTRCFVPALKPHDRIALKPLIRSADCTPPTRDKFQVSSRITLRLNTSFSAERNRLASSRHASRSAPRYNIDPRLKIDKATRGDSGRCRSHATHVSVCHPLSSTSSVAIHSSSTSKAEAPNNIVIKCALRLGFAIGRAR